MKRSRERRPKQRATALILGAAIALSAACAPAPKAETNNPFAAAAADSSTWVGAVREKLDAGSYVYLLVDRPGAEPAWVVTLRASMPDANRVSVRVLRKSEHFESKLLGRSFSPLHFALLRKEPS